MTRLTAKAGSSPSLHPEAAGDVAENVLDLVAKDDQDHDDDHRDEDQDQRVLDHTLTFVTAEYFEESLEDERMFHGFVYLGKRSLLLPLFGQASDCYNALVSSPALSSIDG
jgi:hypothetical protein